MNSERHPEPAIAKLNKALKGLVPPRKCQDVKVFALYWEDEEEGFKDEGKAVCQMFNEVFHYPTREFPIPTKDSLLHLSQFVLQEIPKGGDRRSLCIIHYGGHGDRNDDMHFGQERKSVWAAHREGGPILEWHKIQSLIKDLDTDILLILDCCYAGQAARDRGPDHGGFEVLAAAAMGVMTPPPGINSFTTHFIREVRATMNRDGFINIKDLHGYLCAHEQGLTSQPVHVALKGGRTSIELRPLSTTPAKKAQPFFQLLVYTEQELTSEHADRIEYWLRTNLPYNVSKLEVTNKADTIQIMARDIQQDQTSLIKHGNKDLRTQTTDARGNFVRLAKKYLAADLDQELLDNDAKSVHIGESAKQLDTNDAALNNLPERAFTESLKINSDNEVVDDNALKAIGISNQPRIRKIIRASDLYGRNRSSSPNENQFGRYVMQEYKWYGGSVNSKEIPAMNKRVIFLYELLSVSKENSYCTLRCIDWSHEISERRYVFTFETPTGLDGSTYETLTRIIRTTKGRERPSINQRIKIASLLAKAVHKWHLLACSHRGISSPNVIFFRTQDGRLDYSKPFLHGFDFARSDSDSSPSNADDDMRLDIYRHPDNQGSLTKGYQKKHDFYSLGVVLLELGLWQCCEDYITKGMTANHIQSILQEKCTEQLAHDAGDSYQSAVDVCLSGDFGVDLDYSSGIQLLEAFYTKVVDEISKGVRDLKEAF
ncbi:uncharacterized protein F4822DRAFT_427483 [Hypoxylon trugodes]|uniref:uncharacterized protein n=1 Tax=Hypoxylon trugodes TaxID=326681 RepID=UPI0021A15A2C|nr:uncharacterized protein F4822DRAFT_427483 [Hypoxylon trugodes]KAI1391627.1 hypothetical protein F4822DRAFT_427483 [Hypoxylon trugodes]